MQHSVLDASAAVASSFSTTTDRARGSAYLAQPGLPQDRGNATIPNLLPSQDTPPSLRVITRMYPSPHVTDGHEDALASSDPGRLGRGTLHGEPSTQDLLLAGTLASILAASPGTSSIFTRGIDGHQLHTWPGTTTDTELHSGSSRQMLRAAAANESEVCAFMILKGLKKIDPNQCMVVLKDYFSRFGPVKSVYMYFSSVKRQRSQEQSRRKVFPGRCIVVMTHQDHRDWILQERHEVQGYELFLVPFAPNRLAREELEDESSFDFGPVSL